MELTVELLMEEAVSFGNIFSGINHTEVLGVTDGKAVNDALVLFGKLLDEMEQLADSL